MLKSVNKEISSVIDTLNAEIGNLLCIDKSLKGLEVLSLPFNDYDVKNLPYELSFLHDCIVDCSGEISLAKAQLSNFISGYDVCVCEQNTPSVVSCDDLLRIDNGLECCLDFEQFFSSYDDCSLPPNYLNHVHIITNLLSNYRDLVSKLLDMGVVVHE